MEQRIERLTNALLAKNKNISVAKARTWMELLWSDFESSSARAGYGPANKDVVENIIKQWIHAYGDQLHEFAGRNPKYIHLLDESDNYQ